MSSEFYLILPTPDDDIDAHMLEKNLWQGSAPPPGPKLRQAGFDVLVLCAFEHQPGASMFPGVEVVYAPNDDNPSRLPTREELRIAVDAADKVVAALRKGQKVLVTCWAGRNRSGLVSAISLHKLLGVSGNQAVTIIQMLRPKALTNAQFQACLARLPATVSASSKP